MDDFAFWAQSHTPFSTMCLRLGVAALFGMILGFDRELRSRSAGLRTHMLVSIAAALFTLMAIELAVAANQLGDAARVDSVRVIEAVTAGVAFLGAGAIIRSGGDVRGLTTGASMWLAGAIGVAAGGGYYAIGMAASILGVIVLAVIGYAESRAKALNQSSPDDDS